MSAIAVWSPLSEDLFRTTAGCSVYLLRRGDTAVVVDAGDGRWMARLDELGVRRVEAVILTHGHRDQCSGLTGDWRERHPALAGARVVAPSGDAGLLDEAGVRRAWETRQANGCPPCYSPPARPVQVDATLGADSELEIGGVRLCAVPTPGHTRGALSYIVAWHGRQLALCGDAARADGRLHEPWHLEWDHWTPEGALAAWYGLERLAGNRIDWLLPAHGPPLEGGARATLQTTQRRLLAWVRAKTAVAPGASSRWTGGKAVGDDGLRLSEHLYAFGGNGFLIAADDGGAFVVDPTRGDLPALRDLLARTGLRPVAATATHYHVDHTDALDDVRREWGTEIWLHPWVAEPVRDRNRWDLPWLPPASIAADRALPESGDFRWRGQRFSIRPFPGQTWWHCAFDTEIDGRRVLFSGDNFQPPTRWNGTGGFCAYNGSRFSEGFRRSAETALELGPDLVCNGHRCIYTFDSDHYRRILGWCARAEAATRELCPAGDDWRADYDPRALRFEPFVQAAARGDSLRVTFAHSNHRGDDTRLTVTPLPARGFTWSPARRTLTVPAGGTGRARFELAVADAEAGRHPLTAHVQAGDQLHAEAAVTLVDVREPTPPAATR